MKKSSRRSRFVPVELGKIEGTRVVLEAVPEPMTAFGGAPMLAAMEKKVGLVAELSELITTIARNTLWTTESFPYCYNGRAKLGWVLRMGTIAIGCEVTLGFWLDWVQPGERATRCIARDNQPI